MKHRAPIHSLVLWGTLRAAIKLSDWLREVRPLVVLGLILISVGPVCLTYLSARKSWVRLFCNQRELTAKAGEIQPQTINGYTLTSLDAPGAGAMPATGTVAIRIDANGDVADIHADNTFVGHGFLGTANGTITTFDAHDAAASALFSLSGVSMAVQHRAKAITDQKLGISAWR